MNELIDVTVNIYFKVHDSEIWGGQGSVGYTQLSYDQCRNIKFDRLNDTFLSSQIRIIADSTGVNENCVCVISKEEYEENTVLSTLRRKNERLRKYNSPMAN